MPLDAAAVFGSGIKWTEKLKLPLDAAEVGKGVVWELLLCAPM